MTASELSPTTGPPCSRDPEVLVQRSMSARAHQQAIKDDRIASDKRKMQKIQNYVIYQKTLGAGSMGKVKLAECLTDTDHRQYAVKIMPKIDLSIPTPASQAPPKDPKDTPSEREHRTQREMAIMQLLRHPNICQLKEWMTEGDRYYMFLEYVDGGQLLDYIISHGKLREKQARKFSRQIVSALDYCHRNSIVHRDLKIENILITRDENIKIIDFGLSNIYSPLRQLNTFCGSLYFAAPELLQAHKYIGPEVDVWSLGIVLYVLVCGRVPFDDTSLPALHAKIKAGVVVYPDHLSKDCIHLLSNILVVDPLQRKDLSFVRNHPWLNKGHDAPVDNHLPHRLPLTTPDPAVIQGMQGFGLGTPDAILSKLTSIFASKTYQEAAAQIDHNYQLHQLHIQSLTAPRWRLLSTKKPCPTQDDPQTLPAMYDPLVSIYYLVQEARLHYQTRSDPSLTRRRTERIPKTAKHEAVLEQESKGLSRATSMQIPTRSTSEKANNLKERSKNAARRLGAMLLSGPLHEDEETPTSSAHTTSPTSTTAIISTATPTTTTATSTPKTLQKTLSILRSHSVHDKNKAPRSRPHSTETMLIGHSIESGSTEISENMPTVSVHPKSLFNFSRRHLFRVSPAQMAQDLQSVLSRLAVQTRPTGEPFTLECEILFPDWTRFTQPMVDATTTNSGFSGHSDSTHTQNSNEPHGPSTTATSATSATPASQTPIPVATSTSAPLNIQTREDSLHFTIMIYQARWAGGRLGVKVKEAEDEINGQRVYANLYHTILNELGQLTV